MTELEQNIVIEQVDKVNWTVLASDSDDVNDRALDHRLDWTAHSELVDLFLLDHVPELESSATVEEHLVDIGNWVNDASKLRVA